MNMQIDLNSDFGEGYGKWTYGNDPVLIELVSTASIACGFHAGDPNIMRSTIRLARDRGVAIGAHPGYQDLPGFGLRRLTGLSISDLESMITYQIGAMAGMCALEGCTMSHVKMHAALANACADDEDIAMAAARAIRAVDPSLAFMVMPGTAMSRAAEALNITAINEVYADRTYTDNFTLTPKTEPNAFIRDADIALNRLLNMISDGCVTTESGKKITADIHSIFVHGDTPDTLLLTKKLRKGLEVAGWTIGPRRLTMG